MTAQPPAPPKRHLNPRKLLLSKWTAVSPREREKHFIVSKVYEPLPDSDEPLLVQLEAVYTGRAEVLPWQGLLDTERWRQGWD